MVSTVFHTYFRVLLLVGLAGGVACPVACGQNPAKPHTYPRRLLLIRHAEKLTGEVKSVHISPEGEKRAELLHELFEKSEQRPNPFPKPDFILAASNSASSHRPKETVAPLAKRLELKVNDDHPNDDVDGFVNYLFSTPKYAGKVVLVAWRHKTIPALAEKLGAADAPKEWKDDQFARVWDFQFDEKGHVTFHDRPQHLMPGDAEK
jgi:hypothetical protein